MKFTFFCDIPPGFDPAKNDLMAYTFNKAKPVDAVRVQFEVVIPDKLIHQVDEDGIVEEQAEEWVPGQGVGI